MRFSDKTAIVTGASVGIGRACAMKLATEGARLALVDIDREKLFEVKRELICYTATENILTYTCDVSDEAGVNAAVHDIVAHFGGVDILINNAAIWRKFEPFVENTYAEWEKFFSVNVLGTMAFSRAVIPYMTAKKYGRIINIGSVAGVYGNANMVLYFATKGAVIAFTRELAKELAPENVLVNCVSPGSVSPAQNPDTDYVEPSTLSFLGRTGSDRENANLICFLASDEASYVSGRIFRLTVAERSSNEILS